MSPAYDVIARCRCGHEASEHIVLPGHPDGAVECQHEKCECGRLEIVMRGRSRWA